MDNSTSIQLANTIGVLAIALGLIIGLIYAKRHP